MTFAVASANRLCEAVVGAALDQDARAGAAVLARVVEDRVRGGRGCALEVGVGEDHVGGFAAELERDALDGVRGAAHDPDADLGRAGEADLRHVGVLDEPLADHGALPDEDVHDALGNAGFEDEVGEPKQGERGQLGGLDDDRVPARESRAELPGGDVEREVPRHDQPDHAERLAEGHVDAVCDRNRRAVVLVDRARVEVEHVGHHADLAAGAADRLADVLRLDQRELFPVLLDERRKAPQQPSPVGRRNGAPPGERPPSARDGRVSLLDAGLLERRDRLLGRRVDDGQRHALDSITSPS